MVTVVFDSEMLDVVRTIVRRLNLDHVDNTTKNGPFWVICGREWATLFELLGMEFSPSGGGATHGRPAWHGTVRIPVRT